MDKEEQDAVYRGRHPIGEGAGRLFEGMPYGRRGTQTVYWPVCRPCHATVHCHRAGHAPGISKALGPASVRIPKGPSSSRRLLRSFAAGEINGLEG